MNAAPDRPGPRLGEGPALSAAEAAMFAVLGQGHTIAGYELPELASRYVRALGAMDAACYLADLQQTVLVPFLGPNGPDPAVHAEPLAIDSTLAGRAYQHVQVLTQHVAGGATTVWLPMLDGAERLGVLAVTVDRDTPELTTGPDAERLRRCASLLAELVMTKTSYGDSIVRLRRQAQMGLAAEMQWSLLPPLTFASRAVTIAAALEPAYDVAGDTVDYAADAGVARIAVFDGMGHGLRSAQSAVTSVAAYRHARRASRSLVDTCREVDETLQQSFGGAVFTTGVLAELDTDDGVLRWVNAGHPEPLLMRHGRLVKSLHVRPRPPLGVDLDGTGVSPVPTVGSEHLEPGDCVLLYTDGVTEARSPDGDFFGEQRLVDLICRNIAAGLPAPETMRRVIRALLEHQQGHLSDDASLVLVRWRAEVDTITP